MNPNTAKTHCIHGHPFDEANTIHYRNARICRTCRDARNRETPKQRRLRRLVALKAKQNARAEEVRAKGYAAEKKRVADLEARMKRALAEVARVKEELALLTVRRFCTRGHEIPADRDKCGQCAKRGAIARFYAKKKQATRPTP